MAQRVKSSVSGRGRWREGKSAAELDALEKQVEKKLASGQEGLDVEYWESLLAHLHVHMAKARIREFHHGQIELKLKRIR
ncbi:unnamed protein product, partial [Anisakis simplex]|uniref:Cactin_mid domain-containing protein n=1 Tax=Anisakis simplex TaxID=6269 RepID=A0A0M3JPW4_ANISI